MTKGKNKQKGKMAKDTPVDAADVIKPSAGDIEICGPPTNHPSASTIGTVPGPSAARRRQKKRKHGRRQRKKQAQEAHPTGPAEAITSTTPEMNSADIPENMKTSIGVEETSGVVVPKKDHEPSENSKTDMMPANSMVALESSPLTASAPELLGPTGPLIVDMEEWQESCSEKTQADPAACDTEWAATILQQLVERMSFNPIVLEPKSFSEPASPLTMKPTPLEPLKTWSDIGDFLYSKASTVSLERAQQLSPISHLGRHPPSQAAGQSNADQSSTHCQALPNCMPHSQGVRGMGSAGRRSCCCAHQPLHCQLQANPLEGSLTFAPQPAFMPGQSECSGHGQQQQVSGRIIISVSPPTPSGSALIQNPLGKREIDPARLVGETRGRRGGRPMLFVEDVEREMHARWGVKESEKPVDEELTPVVSFLFQLSRCLRLRSSPKQGNVNTSSPSLLPPRRMKSSSQRSSPSSHTPTMRVFQQEVILPVPPRPEGEVLSTPSLYFTPKQVLGSSPSGSISVGHPQMSHHASQKSAGLPIAGSGKSDVSIRSIGVTEHLKTLFETAAFADLQIVLRPGANPDSETLSFSVHKALVSAFPFLRDVLQAKSLQGQRDDIIDAFTGPGFTNTWAFRMALETRYGGQLVRIEDIRYHALCGMGWADQGEFGYYPFSLDLAKAEFALCYAAAGAFMGDTDIIERGIRMAIKVLTWSTVELIMSFGMAVENFMITCPDLIYHSPRNSPMPWIGPRPVDPRMEHIPEFKYMWAGMALDAAVQWLVSEMKPDFKLYHRGQATFTPNRIPAALQTNPGSHCTNVRLESIQFGSLPSLTSLQPTRVDFIVPSGLLITLPYEMLAAIIDAMKAQEASQILTIDLIQEIVEVREARRLHAIHVHIVRSQEWDPMVVMIPPDELAVLGYRESVNVDESEHHEDYPELLRASLQREWVGFDQPNEPLPISHQW